VTNHLPSLGLVAFAELFDGLPRVIASIKGSDLRYIYANQAFADIAGGLRVADVIGKRSTDLFDADMGAVYEEQDLKVLANGRPLQEHLEVISTHGVPNWFVTSKARFLHDDGKILGVVCVSIDAVATEDTQATALATALAAVRAEPSAPWRAADLATAAHMSVSQLERLVKRVYAMSPSQVVQRIRFEAAMHLLSHSDTPIAEIATTCGFYDQPNFTRVFRSATGSTPGAYRSLHPFRTKT
jgi:AraC-like DNA-binding protein